MQGNSRNDPYPHLRKSVVDFLLVCLVFHAFVASCLSFVSHVYLLLGLWYCHSLLHEESNTEWIRIRLSDSKVDRLLGDTYLNGFRHSVRYNTVY